MTDSPINSVDELLAAFGATSLDEVAWNIDEAAADVSDDRVVTIDDADNTGFTILVDVLGTVVEFPTTVAEIIETANDLEILLQEQGRAYRIVPGHPESQVIIHVPHSSRAIPDDIRRDTLLDDDALQRELDATTDAFNDVIAERAADRLGLRPWIFVNEISRLVVDPERFPDESEEMNTVGMGAIYTRTSTDAPLRDEDEHDNPFLLAGYFDPYAAGFNELVDQRLRETANVTIIDLHSFPREALPYELHGAGPRPEVCLGTNPFRTAPHLLEAARAAFSAFEIGQDAPFSGCYVPLAHLGKDNRVQAMMIELRRDLYMDETFQLIEVAVEPIVEAIYNLLKAIDAPIIISCPGMLDMDDAPHFGDQDE